MKRADGVEATAQASDVAVVMDPAAQGFVREQSLARELDAALEIAKECLTGAARIRVEFAEDPEGKDAPPSIVLRVDGPLSRTDFRSARKRFYRSVRGEEFARLYAYVVVVRD